MADVTIRIEALDLTQNAVNTAIAAFRRLTGEASKSQASATITRTFKNMTQASRDFSRKSTADLRKLVNERQRALRTMELMEVRFQLRIQNAGNKNQRDLARKRLRRTQIIRRQLNQETRAVTTELKARTRAENEAAKNARRIAIGANRYRQSVLRARRQGEQQYFREKRQREAKAEREERERLLRRKKRIDQFFSGLRNAGFNLIFAGSLAGSQASLFGGQLGGGLTSLASTLRSGFTNLNQLIPKSIRLITQLSSLVTKAAGGIAALFISLFGNLTASLSFFIPKVGFLFAGLLVGTTNLVSGIVRGITDAISGLVEVAGGLVEGLVNTVSSLVTTALTVVGDAITSIFSAVGSVLGKVGDLAGKVLGKVISTGIDLATTGFRKFADFQSSLADIFTQTPEIGADKFKLIEESIISISNKLPLLKKDLASGLFEIVSTQLTSSPEEALQVLEGVAKATVAGGSETDVFSVAQAATGVLSAFNLKAEDTEATLSKMFKTAILGRFNFKQLSDGIQAASGIAANFDVTLDDLLSTLVLASKSLVPRQVFVGTKNLVLSLAAPTFEAKKAMDQLGISLKTYTAEEKKGLSQREARIAQMEKLAESLARLRKRSHSQKLALRDLRKELKRSKDEFGLFQRSVGDFIGINQSVQKLSALDLKPEQLRKIIPEKRALAAFAAMVSAQDRASQAIKAITEDTGQAIEAGLEIQTATINNKVKVVTNTIQNTFKSAFNTLAPSFAAAADQVVVRVGQLTSQIDGFFLKNGKTIQDATKFALTNVVDYFFDAIDYIIKNWSKIVDGAKQTFNVMSTIFKALVVTSQLVGDTLAKALGDENLGVTVTKTWTSIEKGFKSLWTSIEAIAAGDTNPIIGLVEEIEVLWARMIDFMRSSFADFLQTVEPLINKATNELKEIMLLAKNPIDFATSDSPRTLVADRQLATTGTRSIASLAGANLARSINTFGSLNSSRPGFGEFAKADERDKQIINAVTKAFEVILSRARTADDTFTGLDTFDSDDVAKDVKQSIVHQLKSIGVTITDEVAETINQAVSKDLGLLTESLEIVNDATSQLRRFDIDPKDQDSYFGPVAEFGDIITGLQKSTEAEVRARVDADRARREAEKKTQQLLKNIEQAIIHSPNGINPNNPDQDGDGVSNGGDGGAGGDGGNAGKQVNLFDTVNTTKTEAKVQQTSSSLSAIENHTQNTAKALAGLNVGPTADDPTGLFIGKAPKATPSLTAPSIGDNAIKVALQALAEGDQFGKNKKPKRKKKPKPLSKQDIVRLRKQFNRDRLRQSFQPFGDTSNIAGTGFGIRQGPLGLTLGDPLRNADGEITGFQQRPGAFGPVRVSYKRELARRAKIAELRKAAEKRKAQREIFKKSLESAQGESASVGSSGTTKTSEEASKAADSAAAVEETTKQSAEQIEGALSNLGAAMDALNAEKKDETAKLLDFSAEQIKALEAVGINTAELGNMTLEGTARVAKIVTTLIERVQQQKKEQEDRLRQLEAAVGNL